MENDINREPNALPQCEGVSPAPGELPPPFGNEPPDRPRRSVSALTAVLLCVLVGLASAAFTLMLITTSAGVSLHVVTDDQYTVIERFSKLSRVYSTLMNGRNVSKPYYKELDPDQLVLGAIRGMLSTVGDPYTFYYTAEDMAASNEKSAGTYHGIGIVAQTDEVGAVTVARVYEDSPAEVGGVLAGDRILSVDGTAIPEDQSTALDLVTGLIYGEDGTSVTLTVLRGDASLELTCTRGPVTVSRVDSAILENDIGYICISAFSGDDVTAFRAALDSMKSAGVRGIVLDLRNDPGGLLTDVVAIADEVLPGDVLTYTLDRAGNRTEETIDNEYWDIPMVVLVNGNSASASELFTAAFQDKARGTVVGTATYGKGIVQTVVTFLEDGDGMQYTTESYYSPNGRSIHEVGVTPDVEVALDGTDTSLIGPDPTIDNQLRTAIDELEKLIP